MKSPPPLLFFFSSLLPVQHRLCRPPGTTGAGLQDREPVRISVPRHVLRGQGKDEHFEFEVKVSLPVFLAVVDLPTPPSFFVRPLNVSHAVRSP